MKNKDDENKDDGCAVLVILTVFIWPYAAIMRWENSVIWWNVFTYWQWVIISIPLLILYKNFLVRTALQLSGAVALIVQFAYWAGIVTLPLIKP